MHGANPTGPDASRPPIVFGPAARALVAGAREESERLKHEYIGTEHLLLAVTRESEGADGAALLAELGADAADVRARLEQTVVAGRESRYPPGTDLPYTSRAKVAFELALAAARELGHQEVGVEHLLVGLVREARGIAAQVLALHGVTAARALELARRSGANDGA